MYKKNTKRLYATTVQKKAIFRNWRKLGYTSVRSFVLELFHAPYFGVRATVISTILYLYVYYGCVCGNVEKSPHALVRSVCNCGKKSHIAANALVARTWRVKKSLAT